MTSHPRRIGKFEILERLGEGAMGEVFLARDALLGREVALKALRPAALTAPDARDRFFREAQAAGRMNHPNLVAIHEFGEDQGVLYLAMELVPGDDLARLLETRELPPREMLELLAQVCDGLAYAHQRGILHRDLKPSNIRVTRIAGKRVAKVLDFGIARLAEGGPGGTRPGAFGYQAPECLQSGKTDPRADLFAVGVILYEALAGCLPFGGESSAAVLQRILNEEPAPLDMAPLASISPAIREVLARALARTPGGRHPSAEALAADLRAARDPSWERGVDKEASVRSNLTFDLPGRAAKPPSGASGKAWLLLAIPVALAAAGAGAFAFRHRHRAAPPAAQPAPVIVTPAPPPPPPPEEPKPEAAPKAGFTSMDEADAALKSDPQGALAYLDKVAAAEPDNERALALRIVALYYAGDYRGCSKAMREAKASGHPIWPLALKHPSLRAMLEEERDNPRLPRKKPVEP